jgi:hypothetical protein
MVSSNLAINVFTSLVEDIALDQLRIFIYQLKSNYKSWTLIASLLVVFLCLGLETAFPVEASKGVGEVVGFHVLETNTGSKTQLKVSYRNMLAIGDFFGSPIPSKGDHVTVVHQKTRFLRREIFAFRPLIGSKE